MTCRWEGSGRTQTCPDEPQALAGGMHVGAVVVGGDYVS